MRADLAATLLHDPKIIFLDEPTIGLDVVAKERIRQFIRSINQEREVTVILTTHDLGDVEKLCKRVIMIDRGRLLFDGLLSTLCERFGADGLSASGLIARVSGRFRIGDLSVREPEIEATVRQIYEQRLLD